MMQLALAVRLYKSHEAAIAAYENQHWLSQDKEAEIVQQLETSIRDYKSQEAAISAYIEAGQGWLTEGRDEEAEIAAYIEAGQLWLKHGWDGLSLAIYECDHPYDEDDFE